MKRTIQACHYWFMRGMPHSCVTRIIYVWFGVEDSGSGAWEFRVWRESFMCDMRDITNSRRTLNSQQFTSHCKRHTLNSQRFTSLSDVMTCVTCVTSLIHAWRSSFMCDVTHLCEIRQVFPRLKFQFPIVQFQTISLYKYLIHTVSLCGMTQSCLTWLIYVTHDWVMYVMWLIHMRHDSLMWLGVDFSGFWLHIIYMVKARELLVWVEVTYEALRLEIFRFNLG